MTNIWQKYGINLLGAIVFTIIIKLIWKSMISKGFEERKDKLGGDIDNDKREVANK